MKLDARHKAFKTDEVTYLDRKNINLDRAMLRLFRLLRFNGKQDVRIRRLNVSLPNLVELMTSSAGSRFDGFAARADIAEAWLRSDLLDFVSRGRPNESVVGPRPFHLNAFKLTEAAAVQDYGASDQVWAMLHHADPAVLTRLKDFFIRGLDPALDQYDGATELDLHTQAVLNLVDLVSKRSPDSGPSPVPIRPLCMAQAHLLAEDLRRLLAYEDEVPRLVLADYVRTTMGLHLALYMFRLLRLVPATVASVSAGASEVPCALGNHATAGAACPFAGEIVVDLTDDPRSGPGELARRSADDHLGQLGTYVRAIFTINRLKDFANALDRSPRQRALAEYLAILGDPPDEFEGFFRARLADLNAGASIEGEVDPIEEAILDQPVSSLTKLVELVTRERLPNERKRLIDLLDSLAQKNKPGGFLRQSAGARSPRWFVLGGQLLETLAQIAVIDQSSGTVRSRPMLIDDFLEWLRSRYGFVVYAPAHRTVPPEEFDAWRRNERAFRERLQQVGYFTDLSDAFNSQTIRPRFEIGHD